MPCDGGCHYQAARQGVILKYVSNQLKWNVDERYSWAGLLWWQRHKNEDIKISLCIWKQRASTHWMYHLHSIQDTMRYAYDTGIMSLLLVVIVIYTTTRFRFWTKPKPRSWASLHTTYVRTYDSRLISPYARLTSNISYLYFIIKSSIPCMTI